MFVRFFVVLLVSWCVASATCAQEIQRPFVCPMGAICTPLQPPRLVYREPEHDYGKRAFGAGVLGAVSAGLVFGGGVAIASSERLRNEPVVQGVWLGTTILAVPVVGFTSFAVRQRVDLRGFQQLLLWGFATWTGGVLNQGLQLSAALHDVRTPWGLTLAAGGLSALGITAFTIDAFATAHRARLKQGYRVVATGPGIAVYF